MSVNKLLELFPFLNKGGLEALAEEWKDGLVAAGIGAIIYILYAVFGGFLGTVLIAVLIWAGITYTLGTLNHNLEFNTNRD